MPSAQEPTSKSRFSSMTDDMMICHDMALAFNKPHNRPRTRSSGISLGMERSVSLPVLSQASPSRGRTEARERTYKQVHGTESFHDLASLPEIQLKRPRPRVPPFGRDEPAVSYPFFTSPTFKPSPAKNGRPVRTAIVDAADMDAGKAREEPKGLGVLKDDPFRAYILRKNKKSHLIRPPKLRPLQSHSIRPA